MEGNSNVSCLKEHSVPVAAESSAPPQSLRTSASAISNSHITGISFLNKTTTAGEAAFELPGR